MLGFSLTVRELAVVEVDYVILGLLCVLGELTLGTTYWRAAERSRSV